MALIRIRNSNKYIYRAKSAIRRRIYTNPLFLMKYLKLKEIFIKYMATGYKKNGLFKKIFIETVSYCNNDCIFCPASSKAGIKKPENFMSEDLYAKILKELKGISFKGSVAFHCNNEPLLDKRLASWIARARGLLKTNYFYLYTNGILIDIKLANQLFDAGLNRIIIDNYNDEHELIPSVRDIRKDSFLIRGEIIVDYRFKNDYFGNRAGESPNAEFFLKKALKLICTRPSMEIVVGYDGTVPLCCADGLWRVKIGNARKSNLKDIWFSDAFRSARRSLLKGDRSCTEICKVCDALHLPSLKGI